MDVIRCTQNNWAEQAGLQQWRVFRPMFPGREGEAARWTRLIFQEPGGPLGQRRARLRRRLPGAILRQLFIAD